MALGKKSTIQTDAMTILTHLILFIHRNYSNSVKSLLLIKNEHFFGTGLVFLGLFVATE